MHRYLLLCWVFLAGACSHGDHDKADPKDDDRFGALEERFEIRKASLALALDPATGWPSPHDCDGLLWAGKAAATGLPVNLALAEHTGEEPGRLHRRPEKPCYTEAEGDVGSKSTISNDMILGWLVGVWSLNDYEALRRVAAYGEAHNWVMGDPPSALARVYLKPNQQGLIGRMLHSLSGGSDNRSYRHLFTAYSSVSEDYERHIQALGILLQGDVDLDKPEVELTGITDQMLARLNELVQVEPKNPLFHAILSLYTGDFTTAIDLLLDDTTPVPTYVRGERQEVLAQVEWVFAAWVVVKAMHAEEAYP